MQKVDWIDIIIWALLLFSIFILVSVLLLYFEIVPTPDWLQSYIERTAQEAIK